MPATDSPLVVIVGPTGSGKSELALHAAERLGGEIVNCDSVQIYRGFDIGSAKTPPGQRRSIPHRMIDIAEPGEIFTAGEYARRARAELSDIAARGRLPIVAGGTGFYLRALLYGLSPAPRRDEAMRQRLLGGERKRPGSLHRLLLRLDRDAGLRIHPNDVNKTLRALEIRLLRHGPRSTLGAPSPLQSFRTIKIGLDPPRPQLHERLDLRLEGMFERGLADEVRGLLLNGVPAGAKPFEALGYKQALALVEEKIDLAQALNMAKQATRQYARRQMTWFRREPGIEWFAGFGGDPGVRERILEFLRTRL